MKKHFQNLKLALLITIAFGINNLKSQCVASFVYGQGANGLVTFTSTSTLANSITTQYFWNYGVTQFSATGSAGMFPSFTYTANGTYSVYLYIASSAPSCTSSAVAVITITNVGSGGCNLNANFTSSNAASGLVNFNNTSTGTVSGTTYTWNFGNGNTSNATSPSNTYTVNGTYMVTLSASNNTVPACISTKTLNVTVSNICNLTNIAQTFTTNGSGGYSFTWTPNANTGIYVFNVNWGNGNTSSGVIYNNGPFFQSQNYLNNGIYTITAIVTATAVPGCSAMVTQTISVANVTCNLNPSFTKSNGASGLVNFNNTSTGTVSGTTYNWSFGDGGTSTSTSPAHAYTANGNYLVTLTANNNFSVTCSGTSTTMVFISNVCSLNASYTSTLSNNGLVLFSNTTTGTIGATNYSWTFGDGGTSSAFSPSHTYTNGTYTVKLTASTSSNAACTSTFQTVITVISNTCLANSNFSLVFSGTPKLWYAMPSNTLNIAAVQWSWGDGSVSSSLFTSHQYSVAAMYSICLSVTLNCGQSSQSCATYSIYKGAGSADNEIYTINVIEEGSVGLKEDSRSLNQKVAVYPNPTSGRFVISLEKEIKSETNISITNLIGETVYTAVVKNQITEVELNRVPNGVYIVRLENIEGTSVSKILIQK